MNAKAKITQVLDGADVLITGGAGAIGNRLVRRLLREPVRKILVIDDLSSGFVWLLPKDPRLELVVADVNQLDTLDIPLITPHVFHLAALFANQNSVDHPFADLHVNGRGTLAALRWAEDRRARRFVFASAGCSIAGHGVEGPIREDLPPSLDMDTPYQITKLLGELYCNYFAPRLSTVRCRFFNSFGPGEVPGQYRNVIPNFIWSALHGRPLVITGTGQETRDFIFVDDLVEGLVLAATTPEAGGQAFNLGTGHQTRIIDLARAIRTTCQSQSPITFTERRAWDRTMTRQADISKAETTLGFVPRVEFAEGLGRTVAWFLENRDLIAKDVRTREERAST